jgi:hypothetical protein
MWRVGLVTAAGEAELTQAAARLFQSSPDELEAKGELMHKTFSAQHTWETRWRQLVAGREYRDPNLRFEAPAPPSAPTVPMKTSFLSQAA